MIHRRHTTSIAVAIATVLLMAGPAVAAGKFMPMGGAGQAQSVSVLHRGLISASHGPTAAVVATTVTTGSGRANWPDTPPGGVPQTANSGPTTVHVTSAGNSFDWGDAAIGAGAAVIVMLLAAGAVRLTRHRPHPGLAKTA